MTAFPQCTGRCTRYLDHAVNKHRAPNLRHQTRVKRSVFGMQALLILTRTAVFSSTATLFVVSPTDADGIAHECWKVRDRPGSGFQSIGRTAQAEASAGHHCRSVWQYVGAAGQATPAEVQEVDPHLNPTLHRTHGSYNEITESSNFHRSAWNSRVRQTGRGKCNGLLEKCVMLQHSCKGVRPGRFHVCIEREGQACVSMVW